MDTFEEILTMEHTHLASSSSIESLFSTERRAHALIQNVIRVALIILACFVTVLPATAQTVQYTQGKADQALRSDLRVDPSTLGMSIQVPIGSYPGRGPSLPISLNYSSKLWRINFDSSWETSFGPHTASHPVYAEFSKSGWTTSLSVPEIEWTGNQQVFDSDGNAYCMGCPDTVVADQLYINRLSVHMPDGSSHELRKNDTPVTSDQLVHTGVYLAVDGSHLRYDADTQVLWLPDGSTYSLGDASYVYFRDRNGNTLTYNRSTKKWTDALGRAIDVPLPNSPAAQDYTYTIPGGTYTLKWRNLENVLTDSNQALRYTGGLCNSIYSGQSPSLFTSSNMDHLCSSTDRFNPVVLWQVVLPNGGTYTFNYNVYGEIDKVAYPTGGYERFNHQQVSTVSYQKPLYAQANRGVVDRWVSPSGSGADEAHWHYETSYIGQTTLKVSTTAPDETRDERLLYANSFMYSTAPPYGFDDVLLGMAFEERSLSSTGQMLRRSLTEWETSGPMSGGHSSAQRDPRVIKEVAILLDTGGDALTSTVTYGHDADQNVISTNRYDYAALDSNTAQTGAISTMPQGTILRTDETTFLVNDPAIDYGTRAAYRSRNFLSLPTSARVKNAQGAIIAQSAMRYDEAAYPLLTYSTVTGWTDPQTNVRGNVTTTGSWLDTTNTYLETHAQYDQFGNVRSAWDARGSQSQMEYDSAYTYAYPTKIITPVPDPTNQHGSNVAFTTTSTFDAATGRTLSTTDANGQVTTFEYASTDALGAANPARRLTRMARPDGGWTAYAYGDQPGNLFIMTRTAQDSTHNLDAYQYLDGLGRTMRAAQSDIGGAYIYADTQYDQMGRVWRVSNPYRTGDQVQWSTSDYDDLGRVKKVTTPDEAEVVTVYSANTTGTLGSLVTVTDQAGKKRKSLIDALGRLAQITEDPDGLGYQTGYAYDVLGNLLIVTQGTQTRTFIYDSLSRLSSATNPESGTISYQYDTNGNLTLKTDPRLLSNSSTHQTTTYVYDALNRPTTRLYNDGTPTVTYIYDATGINNSKGRLTTASSSVSASHYTGYDALGRVTYSSQVTDGQTYSMSYAYDLAGNLISQTYPSGRVVTTSYDGVGRLSQVSGQKSEDANQTYVSSLSYTSHGAVKEMKLGNNLWEHTSFNARLQPTEIGLGTTQNGIDRLKLNYSYGATNNNGNVQSQTITIPNGPTLSQSYTYDALNRLQSAQENNGSSWKQTFIYDRFGNRNFDTANTTANVLDSLLTIDQANNRFTAGQGSILYDSAGNLTRDFNGHTFGYDGENHQVTYDSGAVAGGTDYKYDGDGRRVKKVTGTGQSTTIFVYNAAGQLVAEYDNFSQQSTGGTSYLTTDNLGTPRIITDASGNVKARHDYLPFGEEIAYNVGGRSAPQRYAYGTGNLDNVRKKFTQYEQDIETSLYYTWARYYSSQNGRFQSPDPYWGSAVSSIPQSWNRYTYCLNRPFTYVDPLGLTWLRQRDRDNGSIYWVDDDIYEKNKDKFNDFEVIPNGTVMQFKTIYNEEYKKLEGEWVQLNADGSISRVEIQEAVEVRDNGGPTIDFNPNAALGELALRCERVANIGGWLNQKILKIKHWWIKTPQIEAGAGPANGGIPGHGGKDSPYVTQMTINDHSGEALWPESTCYPYPGFDVNTINSQLKIGRPLGSFSLENNCQTVASDILKKAGPYANMTDYPPIP
jgi:RHS repeat-associated protein